VALDVFPTKSFEEVLKNVDYMIEEQPNKVAKNAFHSLIPERLLTFYLEKLAIEEVPAKQLTEKQRLSFVELLK
ncbi:hypothetical protein B1P95_21925, partial [Enterococcus faecium]